jgi:hypothetical protein
LTHPSRLRSGQSAAREDGFALATSQKPGNASSRRDGGVTDNGCERRSIVRVKNVTRGVVARTTARSSILFAGLHGNGQIGCPIHQETGIAGRRRPGTPRRRAPCGSQRRLNHGTSAAWASAPRSTSRRCRAKQRPTPCGRRLRCPLPKNWSLSFGVLSCLAGSPLAASLAASQAASLAASHWPHHRPTMLRPLEPRMLGVL